MLELLIVTPITFTRFSQKGSFWECFWSEAHGARGASMKGASAIFLSLIKFELMYNASIEAPFLHGL